MKYNPASGTSDEAIICTVNFTVAFSPIRSSTIPTLYINNRLTKKYIDQRFIEILSVDVLLNTVMAIINATSILGRKATPPSLGIAFLWIFLLSGLSYSPLFLQKSKICGMNMNPHTVLSANAKKERI